jgi:uncharacterized protein (TIGR02996 family)
MNNGEALRRAVLAEPDEDTPRLIYADWLDENGQAERAEFIRAQIEAVRADPGSRQAREARARADTLLEKHDKSWGRPTRGGIQTQYERGFIGRLNIDPAAMTPPVATELFANDPIQVLRVNSAFGSAIATFVNLPELCRIRRLELAPRIGLMSEDYAQLLARGPQLYGLRDLSLRENPVPPGWLAAMLAGTAFPELQGLDFGDIPNIGPGLVAAFARAGHREIRRLDVSRVVFTSEEIQRLLQSPCLRRVEELRLGCAVRRGDVGPLFHLDLGWVIPWDRLRVLNLAGQYLGSEGVKEIVRCANAVELRSLGLANNGLDTAAVRALIESKQLRLSHLDVRGNGLSFSDLVRLQRRFPDASIDS